MNFENLKAQFSESYKELESTVLEALNMLFNKEFTIELSIGEEQDSGGLTSNDVFPSVQIQFDSKGTGLHRHLVSMEADAALKLFAWMIMAEPEEKVTDDHLEGLQEGANQITSSIQNALGGSIEITDLKATFVENSEDEQIEPMDLGMGITYSLAAGEDIIPVKHYIWTDGADDVVVEEDEEIETDHVDVSPVDFDSFSRNAPSNGQSRNIDMLLDVELDIKVELGRKKMLIKDLLKLGKGSVVELDKAAGEPLEIFVSGRKLAEGEVVVVDDVFGIRITQLVGPKERIESLG